MGIIIIIFFLALKGQQWWMQHFPDRGGANLHGGGANLLFGQIFGKNYMKMKEFGSRGGHMSLAPSPLRSAID